MIKEKGAAKLIRYQPKRHPLIYGHLICYAAAEYSRNRFAVRYT